MTVTVSSLDDAWADAVDRVLMVDPPLDKAMLPLLRSTFYCGASYAMLLCAQGDHDALTRDLMKAFGPAP